MVALLLLYPEKLYSLEKRSGTENLAAGVRRVRKPKRERLHELA